jgi:hypothetical protein
LWVHHHLTKADEGTTHKLPQNDKTNIKDTKRKKSVTKKGYLIQPTKDAFKVNVIEAVYLYAFLSSQVKYSNVLQKKPVIVCK